nr:immunoglobulin light chain junction region [Macaca mulatta]
CQQYNSDPYIF